MLPIRWSNGSSFSGGVNGETDELFEFLSSQIEGAENISYSIDATYTSPRPSGMTNAIHGAPPSSLPSREMPNWAGSGILTW